MDVYYVTTTKDELIGRFYSSYQTIMDDLRERTHYISNKLELEEPLKLNDLKVFIEDDHGQHFQIFPKQKPKKLRWLKKYTTSRINNSPLLLEDHQIQITVTPPS